MASQLSAAYVAAVVGFVMIGIVSLACVIFGVIEIAEDDRIFHNTGLGMTLTILGLYFTVPYLLILALFIGLLWNVSCSCLKRFPTSIILLVAVCLLALLQQAVADAYLVILFDSYWALLVLLLDAGMLISIVRFGLSPESGYCYSLGYAVKLGLQWKNAWTLKDESFFGPNGQVALLFLCIPVMQLPLYVDVMSQRDHFRSFVGVFISNFNLFLSHLLHSLDTIALFLFVYTPPHATKETEACPTPFRWLILTIVIIGFLANNGGLLHLFYQRDNGEEDPVLAWLPEQLRTALGLNDMQSEDDARSKHRRMFLYLMLMLVTVDVPSFVIRIELWRQRYYPLDLFIAKNAKDLLDVTMLLIRSDKQRDLLSLD